MTEKQSMELDSREKLEAAVCELIADIQARTFSGREWYPLHYRIIELLDRQAAITGRHILTHPDERDEQIAELQAKVEGLTAERDRLQSTVDLIFKCDNATDAINAHLVERVDELTRKNAELQAKVDERYMPLPLDADGVPWTLKDRAFIDMDGRKFELVGIGYSIEYGEWTLDGLVDTGEFERIASQCKHVKPCTVEELLEEFGREIADDGDAHISYDVISVKAERFAERIRELI